MHFVALLAVIAAIACGPPRASPRATGPADADHRVLRPPANAPPDPLGTARPGDRSCAESRDCRAGERCVAPDYQVTGGASLPCQTDGQCASDQVCDAASCVPRCAADTCRAGETCRPDGRCAPPACTDPSAPVCPQNHRCDAPSGRCQRQACTSRSQCDVGACYQGRCFSHDAYCASLVSPP
jgi:hypothetical protein